MEYYLDFIKKYIINIPEIQRAYVQGADINAQKRDEFIDAIFESMKNLQKPLQLDFIYGSSKDAHFKPIDGQQRLTTLSLIGWILSQRAFSKIERESIPSISIEYKICSSSEQFVNELFSNLDLPEEFKWRQEGNSKVLSEYIRHTPSWYVEQWDNDLSIRAMLDMLDALNNKLNSFSKDEIRDMASNFFNEDKSCVEFESLEMPNYNLTEDLYIKMNARGKHLTRFENWKAEFYGFLMNKYGEKMASEFSTKIEHEWCDLFWKYAIKEWQNNDEPNDVYPRIDEFFMRVFDFVTSILFHTQIDLVKRADELKIDRAKVYTTDQRKNEISVYENESNVNILFSILDKIVDLEKTHVSVDNWLDTLLTNHFDSKDSIHINIYENTELFERLVNGKELSLPLRMLLYAILVRIVEYPKATTQELSDFIRVFWGWLLSRNQRLAALLDVRFDFNLEHLKIAQQVIDELQKDSDALNAVSNSQIPQLDREREKVELKAKGQYDVVKILGNHPYLKGDFSNIYDALSTTTAQKVKDRFLEFANLLSDRERIIELINHGAKGAHPWNDYRFYGLEDHWTYVFSSPTQTKDKTPTSINKAITAYLTQEGNIQQYNADSIEYYILNYEDFLKSTGNNYYYVKDDFTVWALRRISSRPLNGYNSCPYAATVVALCNKKLREDLKLEQYSWYTDHGFLKSDILNLKMECVKDGWLITVVNNPTQDDSVKSFDVDKFINGYSNVRTNTKSDYSDGVNPDNNVWSYLLKDKSYDDRIKTALNFLEDLYAKYKKFRKDIKACIN